MASKNALKNYIADGYYHIYNRGIEKRLIFQDQQDYSVFLSYLRFYLLPKDKADLTRQLSNPSISCKEKDNILKLLRLNNFYDEIILLAYCLMPNHFHLLIKQKSDKSIDKFMNSLGVRYTMYFNRKYKRVGKLCQDVYKAVSVENDPQLLYLSGYIHNNPIKNSATQALGLRAYYTQPSSLPEYLKTRQTEWVHPEEILEYFSKENPQLSYQAFIKQTEGLTPIQELVLDA